MSEIFKSKVRNVGTSLGLLIPKEIAKEERLINGEDIEVVILKKDKSLIGKYFGIDKGTSKFKRDNVDRLERYEKMKKKNDTR